MPDNYLNRQAEIIRRANDDYSIPVTWQDSPIKVCIMLLDALDRASEDAAHEKNMEMKKMSKYFGKNPETHNIDDDDYESEGFGKVGISLFANAIQVWAGQQEQDMTLKKASEVFNCDIEMVEEAVGYHPWMFNILGIIEHDGE